MATSKPAPEPPNSEITPESLYLRRREFIKNGALVAGTAALVGSGLLWLVGAAPPPDAPVEQAPLPAAGGAAQAAGDVPLTTVKTEYDPGEPLTSLQAVTNYNNYYELGLDKEDPARNAQTLQARPWTISVEGEVAN